MDTSPTALGRFLHHKDRIDEALALLSHHMADHCGLPPEGIRWDHVGTLGKVASDLEEVCRFMGIAPTED